MTSVYTCRRQILPRIKMLIAKTVTKSGVNKSLSKRRYASHGNVLKNDFRYNYFQGVRGQSYKRESVGGATRHTISNTASELKLGSQPGIYETKCFTPFAILPGVRQGGAGRTHLDHATLSSQMLPENCIDTCSPIGMTHVLTHQQISHFSQVSWK